MTIPSNGITPEVIRDMMPPYHLDPDLMAAAVAVFPPPPPTATTAWRHTRLTRLFGEIAACRPADAAQACIATQLVITRELADTYAARAHAPALSIEQMCRLGRTATEFHRSAATLDRTLRLHQQKPVPFFGTVIQDELDIAALDTLWASQPAAAARPAPAPTPAARPRPGPAAPPNDPPRHQPADSAPPATPHHDPQRQPPQPQPAAAPPPGSAPPAAPPPDAAPTDAAPTAAPPPAGTAPEAQPQPGHPSTHPSRPAAPGSDWTITLLDEGPGWSREVLRHRSATPTEAAE